MAVHALNRVGPTDGESALVAGAGVIGLCLVQALRPAGCRPIIVIDLQQDRLDLARGVGADHTFTPDAADLTPEVMRLTDGRVVEAAFEAVGITRTLQLAIQCVRKGAAVGAGGEHPAHGGVSSSGGGHAGADAVWILHLPQGVCGLPRHDVAGRPGPRSADPRYGGLRLYRRTIPLAVGLIVGDLLNGMVWALPQLLARGAL